MIVDKFYIPSDIAILYLKKKHYTRDHICEVLKKFRVSFNGKEYKDINEKFKKVMKLEFATNTPKKETGKALKEVLAKQTNKSQDGEQRAQETKQQECIMTQAEVKDFYNKRNGE